jgi:hypothetical protein
MQADSTQFNSIEKMIDKFNFDYLYSNTSYDKEHNRKYMNYSQQEFLVKMNFLLMIYSNLKLFAHRKQTEHYSKIY